MPETAAAQLRRILDVIPRLADGAVHSLTDLARRENIDTATLVRDLQSIASRDDEPGGFVEGVQILLESDRVSMVTSHFRRPMRLTLGELAALELGLAMLQSERAGESPEIARARARLRAVIARLPKQEELPPHFDRHADAGAEGAAMLPPLRAALKARRPVRIAYHKSAAARAEPRDVRPYALAAVRGAWYLVAHCERNGGVRLFRLDRMDGVEPLAGRYEIPDDFVLDRWIHDGQAFHAEGAGTLRVRYSPRVARWIAERERQPLAPDGSLTMEHPLADESWAMRHVLQYGPDAEVLEPESLRASIAERLSSIVAAGRASPIATGNTTETTETMEDTDGH